MKKEIFIICIFLAICLIGCAALLTEEPYPRRGPGWGGTIQCGVCSGSGHIYIEENKEWRTCPNCGAAGFENKAKSE